MSATIPSPLIRVRRTIPVVAHPDSVTHWTCIDAPERAGTHHIVFTGGGRCRYCRATSHTLRQRHLRLLTSIFDVAGGKFKAYQITSWSASTAGTYLVYFEDESGNERRTEVVAREVLRALECLAITPTI